MNTSHLVTEVDIDEIDFDEVYDQEAVETSVNEILGANNSLEQSAEDWMQDVSEKVEAATENYIGSAQEYINGEQEDLEDDARHMAEAMHSLDQSLELLSTKSGVRNHDYRNRMLEIKKRLEKEVIAPVTARALEKGDFTENISETDVDYLLRPVKNKYLDE